MFQTFGCGLNVDDTFWDNCLAVLNVLETYPRYIQDICLDWMEQAIYDNTIPFVHLTEIARIYSCNTFDTRLSQKFINEEKAIDHLISNDSFEIEKLILPSDLLVKQSISNLILYSKVIRLWSVLPNSKGIFNFDLSQYFLDEF